MNSHPPINDTPAPTSSRSSAYRILRGTLAALCGVGLAGLLWEGAPVLTQAIKSHRYFALATIDVEGNRRLDRAEILQWAGAHEGMSVWDAAPGVLRVRLQSHPWIQYVSVERAFPRRVSINVHERHPVAIAQLDELQYVDDSGRLLGPLRDDDSRDLPIITGLDHGGDGSFTTIAVHRALQLLRSCTRIGCVDAVSEIHVDRDRGVTLFPMRPAVAVKLGWGNWREKLARAARVFAVWEG